MTAPDLAAIRARVAKATEGPWTYTAADMRHGGWRIRGVDGGLAHGESSQADAAFIAHARQDIPALLALVEAQGEERETDRRRMEALLTLVERQDVLIGAERTRAVLASAGWAKMNELNDQQAAEITRLRALTAYLLPIVEGQLATRAAEQAVVEHHKFCAHCSQTVERECDELDVLCGAVEIGDGQYEADLARWTISDMRALLAPRPGGCSVYRPVRAIEGTYFCECGRARATHTDAAIAHAGQIIRPMEPGVTGEGSR